MATDSSTKSDRVGVEEEEEEEEELAAAAAAGCRLGDVGRTIDQERTDLTS